MSEIELEPEKCGGCGGDGACPWCRDRTPDLGCNRCCSTDWCPYCGGDGLDHGPIELTMMVDIGEDGIFGSVGVDVAAYLVRDGFEHMSYRIVAASVSSINLHMRSPQDLEKMMEEMGGIGDRIDDAFDAALANRALATLGLTDGGDHVEDQ